VLGLIAVGVVILNAKVLGVPNDGNILLKTVHVWIGYEYGIANSQSGCPESAGTCRSLGTENHVDAGS
jgi:hypothetical protein